MAGCQGRVPHGLQTAWSSSASQQAYKGLSLILIILDNIEVLNECPLLHEGLDLGKFKMP